MSKYYFFKTIKEKKGKVRVVALAGQVLADGTKSVETVNVQSPRDIRDVYPVGTIFVGDTLGLSKRGCYTTRNFRKLSDGMSKEIAEYEVLTKGKFADSMKSATILDSIIADTKLVCPTSKADGFFMSTDDWRLLVRNIKKHVNTMIIGPTGSGKCLGKDTPVLMYDGSIKMVQDVVSGDLLMGPDSKPRKVLTTTTGREELFRVTPRKGDSWVCNKSHILSLKRTNDGTSLAGSIENVEISDYLSWSKTRKHIYKQWRTGVDFKETPVDLDPYFLGLWLGDGFTKSASICTADREVVDYIYDFAKSIGCTVTKIEEPSAADTYNIVQKDMVKAPGRHTEIMKRLLKYDLIGNKHIPSEFLHNTRENRLKLLAGLIDTDGYYHNGYYEYSTKLDNLKDDVVYLSRSLGYYVNCKQKTVKDKKYWILGISGNNLNEIPVLIERKKAKERKQKKNVLVTGISVESIGEGDYYGFTIDGDHLFMLGDFTVTHNTSCVKEVCDRLGIKLHIFDMGCMVDPISSLLGVHRLEKGKSIFDYAKFTQVIQEPCVILLDELNRASLACNNVLFSCLDDRRSLSIEIAGGKDMRSIKVHPDVTFIATANVGAEYTGTNSMDRALVNRFFPLELGCIPSAEEEQVLTKRTGIPLDKSKLIVKIANNIRSLSNKQEVSTSLSIRETLMVAGLVSDGWDLGKAMEMIYLPLYEGTKGEGERSTIYKTISSY